MKINKRIIFNRKIILLIFRVIFAICIVEFFSHVTIIYSLHLNQTLIEKSSKLTISIALLLKGSLFSVQYFVYYGIPTIFNEIVGIKTTPLPCCIALIHTNGELWKNFDTGIYSFIKKLKIL